MTTTGKQKPRLYYPPRHTLETLRAVISGNTTREQLADALDVGTNTAWNKIHDPKHLGLIEANNGTYEATEEARRLIQLQDNEVLEDRFTALPGVQNVLNQLENGGTTAEEIGRVVSFETNSGAADAERFRDYGRVYAQWIQYLDLGEVTDTDSPSQHPLENDCGANNPRVPPQKVIDALRHMDDVDTHEELANRLGHSERYTQKILSTAYALGVGVSSHGTFTTTETGRTVTTTSQGKQRELIRDALLEIPLVQAYCNRVPSGEFNNQAVMQQVSDDYSLGWSDSTVQTRAKRLYQWLLFANLTEERERGVLEATQKMPRGNLPDP